MDRLSLFCWTRIFFCTDFWKISEVFGSMPSWISKITVWNTYLLSINNCILYQLSAVSSRCSGVGNGPALETIRRMKIHTNGISHQLPYLLPCCTSDSISSLCIWSGQIVGFTDRKNFDGTQSLLHKYFRLWWIWNLHTFPAWEKLCFPFPETILPQPLIIRRLVWTFHYAD